MFFSLMDYHVPEPSLGNFRDNFIMKLVFQVGF